MPWFISKYSFDCAVFAPALKPLLILVVSQFNEALHRRFFEDIDTGFFANVALPAEGFIVILIDRIFTIAKGYVFSPYFTIDASAWPCEFIVKVDLQTFFLGLTAKKFIHMKPLFSHIFIFKAIAGIYYKTVNTGVGEILHTGNQFFIGRLPSNSKKYV